MDARTEAFLSLPEKLLAAFLVSTHLLECCSSDNEGINRRHRDILRISPFLTYPFTDILDFSAYTGRRGVSL